MAESIEAAAHNKRGAAQTSKVVLAISSVTALVEADAAAESVGSKRCSKNLGEVMSVRDNVSSA